MKKPRFKKIKNKVKDITERDWGSFKEKIKDIEWSSVKERLEDIKIKKSRLERLKQKITDFEELKQDSEEKDTSTIDKSHGVNQEQKDPLSIKEKYKSLKLLAKTKVLLKDQQPSETIYLDKLERNELKHIQNDLSGMLHSIRSQEKKEVAWQPVKAIPKNDLSKVKYQGLNLKEYWLEQFHSLLSLYAETTHFEDIIKYLSNSYSVKLPLLKRVFSKVSDLKDIWLFSEGKNNNDLLNFLK